MIKITTRQREVLNFIIGFRGKKGYSPTLREIGFELGITSLRGVTTHLKALERKGCLIVSHGVPRGIVPTKIGESVPEQKPGFFRIISGGTPKETKVFSPSGEDISSSVVNVAFAVSSQGVIAKITILAQADVFVQEDSVMIVKQP